MLQEVEGLAQIRDVVPDPGSLAPRPVVSMASPCPWGSRVVCKQSFSGPVIFQVNKCVNSYDSK